MVTTGKKHLRKHQNAFSGMDFCLTVSWCRRALYPLPTEHIALGGAYSNTAAVTSNSRQLVGEVVNVHKFNTVIYCVICLMLHCAVIMSR